MNINWRYALGVGTLVGVVGLSIYAIKKAKDQQKTEEESISVEQAKAEVEDHKAQLMKEAWEILEKEDEDEEEPADIVDENRFEYLEPVDINKIPGENIGFTYDGVRWDVPLIEVMTEEDTILRHEPNSNEARNQFIRMELAEWRADEDTYSILLDLYQHPFITENDGDWDLKTKIIDYRVQFFGFGSRWAKEVSFADVILHYARAATFNMDESVRYWVHYFLQFNEFELQSSEQTRDVLIQELNNHTYYNRRKDTYGLFGLSQRSMDEALKIATMNMDNCVNYEIEFNEFLKAQM